MSKIKSVTTTYADGTEFVSHPTQVYDAANEDCRHLGILCDQVILFPDGSCTEKMSGVNHQPPPIGGQYPRQRFIMIQRYWEIKYERLCDEFDKLKNRLSQRGSSFKVQIGNNEEIDAFQRLKDLSKMIRAAGIEKKNAARYLQQATPQQQRVTDDDILDSQVSDARFYEKVQSVTRPEDEETAQPLQRKSRR